MDNVVSAAVSSSPDMSGVGCGPAVEDGPGAKLQVCVTDAQGLRLKRGGEIRLVLTLRASDDLAGEAFGAKVTPWLAVPENEAPQWRPRSAFFEVPPGRLSQAVFSESAHVHISLWQRGCAVPADRSGGALASNAPAALGLGMLGLKSKSLAAALQQGASSISNLGLPLGGATNDRGEVLAELCLPVGSRLKNLSADGYSDGGSWLELLEGGESDSLGGAPKIKGSLLIQLEILSTGPSPAPKQCSPVAPSLAGERANVTEPVVKDAVGEYVILIDNTAVTSQLMPSKETITAELRSQTLVNVVELTDLPAIQRLRARIVNPAGWISLLDTGNGNRWAAPQLRNVADNSNAVGSTTENCTANMPCSDPVQDGDGSKHCDVVGVTDELPPAQHRHRELSSEDDEASEGGNASDLSASTAATRNRLEEEAAAAAAAAAALQMEPPLRLLLQSSDSGDPLAGDSPCTPAQWRPFGDTSRAQTRDFDAASKMDIFAANERPGDSERLQYLRKLVQQFSSPPSRKMKVIREKLRSALDPGMRKQRKEGRKWRRWHEVFCTLNDIERRLVEVFGMLEQASASMKRFVESHGALQDSCGVSAFLRDAGLYFKSEAELPRRVELRLGELERAADEFRSISLDALAAGAQGDDDADGLYGESAEDPWEKGCSCEDLQVDVAVLLESALMAAQQALAEYKKMHCRLQLLATEYDPLCRLEMDDIGPAFLPLLAESPTTAAAAAVPEQAVEWARDFAQLVGPASRGLEGLLRELEHRKRQLSACATELRDTILDRASCGAQGAGIASAEG
eukprot:TRINITY_DN72779_c0_g1_i1.p1 TRINITY_DN72779_c0_g1~~TRINITY_DN72779_c0_g1_i1.p1  ORF type:complete len:799 (+),score=151.32 TRINITY_DN72779_c0_g1_i1:78-2474(+)